MKRHERPYGCTFPKCRKKFGSKNDWKRHENSQHFQPETWQCDGTIDGACTKVFYHSEPFRTHLTEKHKIEDAATIDQKMESQHFSPNQQVQFWCGFCVRHVDLKGKGVQAWNERFDHIDDHFVGRSCDKKSIEQWIPQDRDAEEAQSPQKPDSSKETQGESSDDSSPSASEGSPESTAICEKIGEDAVSAVGPVPRKRPIVSEDLEGQAPKRAKVAESRIICVSFRADITH
jgi:hypothetical protein